MKTETRHAQLRLKQYKTNDALTQSAVQADIQHKMAIQAAEQMRDARNETKN